MPRSNARGNGSSPEYAELGAKLRASRMGQGLSLRVLADRLGVSPSLISQVETGRAKPSVSTLYAMTAELGISVDDLLFPDASSGRGNNPDGNVATSIVRPPFESAVAPAPLPIRSLPFADEVSEAISAAPDAMPPIPVQPAGSRKAIRLASGVVWERLTTTSIPGVEFLYVTYEVGGASTHEHEFQRHAGQEWGYVISGTLGVTVGFEDYALGPGDAISFDSMTPHRMRNLGKEPVHGIWFQLGRPGVHLSGPAAAPRPAGDADRHKREAGPEFGAGLGRRSRPPGQAGHGMSPGPGRNGETRPG